MRKLSFLCLITTFVLLVGCPPLDNLSQETYRVTYYGNMADSGSVPVDNRDYYDAEYVTVKGNVNNLQRNGYNFVGWSTVINNPVEYYEGDIIVINSSNIALYAVWDNSSHSVVYSGSGESSGICPAEQQVSHNSVFVVSDNVGNLNREGYLFAGWSLTPGADVTYYPGDEIIINGSITLYAVWELLSYNVLYNSVGEDSGVCPPARTVTHNQIILVSTNTGDLTKVGYNFAGWSTSPGSVVEYFPNEELTVNDNMILYAVWVEITNPKVTFHLENESEDIVERFVIYPATNLTELPEVPVWIGYTFDNWYTSPNGFGEIFTINTDVDSDITIYANWTTNIYRLYFNGYNADGGYTPQYINSSYNATVSIPGNVGNLEKEGYTFIGWSSTGNNEDIYEEGDVYVMGDSHAVLYAVWLTNTYTVNYSDSGIDSGSAPASITAEYNSTINIPDNTGDMVKDGFYFLGWSSIQDGDLEYSPGSSLIISENLSLYPVWSEAEVYTVTFYTDEENQEYRYVTKPETNVGSFPEDPVKEGYTFLGWYNSVSDEEFLQNSTVTESIQVNAIWEINSYIVTYSNAGSLSGTVVAPVTYNYGDTVVVDNNSGFLEKTGYTLVGWFTTDDVNTVIPFGETIVMGADNINFRPKWELNSYTVSYHAEGVESDILPQPTAYNWNTQYQVEYNWGNIIRDGYIFLGWSTTEGGTLDYYGGEYLYMGDSNINFYAVWDIKSYSVEYNIDDADDGTVPYTYYVDYGSTIVVDNNSGSLEKTGYTFIGWSTTSGGSLTYTAGEEIIVSSALDLYPVWEINSYTVTYHYGDADGGMAPVTQHADYGSTILLDSNSGSLEKIGYTFSGWSTTSGGSLNYLGGQEISISSDINLYPVWGAEDYYLVYNENGASGGDVPQPVTGNIGSVITVEGNTGVLYKDGYTFQGWSLSDSGSINYTSGDTVTLGAENINLYAVWSINSYNLTYHLGGADGGSVPNSSVHEYNSVTTASVNSGNLYTEGYTFSGWSTELNGTLDYEVGSSILISKNVDLYPVWTINTYTVSFNGNGEDTGLSPNDISADYATNITIPGNTGSLVKEGYELIGWSKTSNGSVEYVQGDSLYVGTSNLELFAIWGIKAYTLTYHESDADGGYAPFPSSVDYGESITISANTRYLRRTGYTFEGWSNTYNGSVDYSGGESIIMGSSNVDLYPVWTINSYNISYYYNIYNSGNPSEVTTAEFGESVTLASNTGDVLLSGYTLAGWSTLKGGAVDYTLGETIVMGSSDTYLYPVWDINSYTITYHSSDADTGSAPTQVVAEFESDVIVSTNSGDLTRVGYRFRGWSTTYNGSLEYNMGSTITVGAGDINLYPVWGINIYSVTYHDTGSDSGYAPSTQYVEYNSTVTTSNNSGVLSKTGYSFIGWSTTENGVLDYLENVTSSAIVSNINLYPVWSINSYTVSFSGNYSSSGSAPSSITDEYNEVIVIPGNDSLLRDNHTFRGWSSSSSGDVEYTEGDTIIISDSNLTLYAVWYKNQTITANISIPTGDTITLSNTIEVTKGDSLNISVEESFNSYSWYLDGSLIAGESAQTLILDSTGMDAKQYELMVVTVNSSGIYSSANCRIRVNN